MSCYENLAFSYDRLTNDVDYEATVDFYYQILERDARIDQASWGGYIRHNQLYRQVYDTSGELVEEQTLFDNDAIMMYSPLLPQ